MTRTACTASGHRWEWLPAPQYTIQGASGPMTAVNVKCTRCGVLAWAHGHGPTNPRPTGTNTPTTERS